MKTRCKGIYFSHIIKLYTTKIPIFNKFLRINLESTYKE